MRVDEAGRRWYKGNLHTHTTQSDGRKTPEEVIALYREHDYDFLALTDHWKLGEGKAEEDFLLLKGCEFDTGKNIYEGIYHIVGIGMERMPELRKGEGYTPGQMIDAIHREGGLAILAHPAWSLNRAEEVRKISGLDGFEIYNSVSGIPWNCRPYSGAFADELASRGMFLPCMAADDSHFYQGEEARSYLWVQAEELTREAILAALREGRFLATQGPIFSVEQKEDQILVHTTPASHVVFFTDLVWEPDRVTSGNGIREASFKKKPGSHFARVEVIDEAGNTGWSSFLTW